MSTMEWKKVDEALDSLEEGEPNLYEDDEKGRYTKGAARSFRRHIDDVIEGLEENTTEQNGGKVYESSELDASLFSNYISRDIRTEKVFKVLKIATFLSNNIVDKELVDSTDNGRFKLGAGVEFWKKVFDDIETYLSKEEEDMILEYTVAELEREKGEDPKMSEIYPRFVDRLGYEPASSETVGRTNLGLRMQGDLDFIEKTGRGTYRVDRSSTF